MFDFVMKQALKAKLKDVPDADQQKIFAMIDKNPDFFKNLAAEVQAEISSGKDQMTAVMDAIKRHGDDLKGLMS